MYRPRGIDTKSMFDMGWNALTPSAPSVAEVVSLSSDAAMVTTPCVQSNACRTGTHVSLSRPP